MKLKKIFLNLLIINFVLYCSSGFYKKERIFLTDNIAIYLLDEKDYPEDKEIQKYLKPVKKFPADSLEKIKFVLSNLEVEKESFFSKDVYPLVYPLQLEQIQIILNDIIPSIPEGKRILIVQKFDPFRTVLSKEKRTTMLIWYDEDGYNIAFGEIHEDLLPDNFSTKSDWLDIFPVSLKQGNPKQKIIKKDFIDYKKIGDFTHYSWILFSEETLQAYKDSIKTSKNKENTASIEERLKKLQDLFNKKLITKEEYDKKKKEILEEL
jgi:hypothetical protein